MQFTTTTQVTGLRSLPLRRATFSSLHLQSPVSRESFGTDIATFFAVNRRISSQTFTMPKEKTTTRKAAKGASEKGGRKKKGKSCHPVDLAERC